MDNIVAMKKFVCYITWSLLRKMLIFVQNRIYQNLKNCNKRISFKKLYDTAARNIFIISFTKYITFGLNILFQSWQKPQIPNFAVSVFFYNEILASARFRHCVESIYITYLQSLYMSTSMDWWSETSLAWDTTVAWELNLEMKRL